MVVLDRKPSPLRLNVITTSVLGRKVVQRARIRQGATDSKLLHDRETTRLRGTLGNLGVEQTNETLQSIGPKKSRSAVVILSPGMRLRGTEGRGEQILSEESDEDSPTHLASSKSGSQPSQLCRKSLSEFDRL